MNEYLRDGYEIAKHVAKAPYRIPSFIRDLSDTNFYSRQMNGLVMSESKTARRVGASVGGLAVLVQAGFLASTWSSGGVLLLSVPLATNVMSSIRQVYVSSARKSGGIIV